MTKLTYKGYQLAIFVVGQTIHVTITPLNRGILPGLVLHDDDLKVFLHQCFYQTFNRSPSFSNVKITSTGSCFTGPQFVAILK